MDQYISYLIVSGVVILAALIVLPIVASYLWNRKWRPKRISQGHAVDKLSGILSRTTRFIFKEEQGSVFAKVQDDPQAKEAKPLPPVVQAITYKKLYLALLLASLAFIFLQKPLISVILIALLAGVIYSRVHPVFKARHATLMRMFEVAASNFKYPRGSDQNPWQWVAIEKWKNIVIPSDTKVTFPNTFRSDIMMSRESFEQHFSVTVTDENSWTYEWNAAKNHVKLVPVEHLPPKASYEGSESFKWNEIPIGIGSKGPVMYDLTASPHVLLAGPTGSGKSSQLTSSIYTDNGWKQFGDLQVGDVVFGVDGKPTRVTHLHPVITPARAYEVEFKNGEKIIVDAEHLWETSTRNERLSAYEQVKNPRQRNRWLDEAAVSRLEAELAATTAADTISIPEIAALTCKLETSQRLHAIAKIIGPAEEVRPKIKFEYKTQIVRQKQHVLYVDSAEAMRYYNEKRKIAANYPFTLSDWQKLSQLEYEVRDSDSLSARSIGMYLNVPDASIRWISKRMDRTLSAKAMVRDLAAKMVNVASPLPAKIFEIPMEHINGRQLSELLDVDHERVGKQLFNSMKRHIPEQKKFTRYEEVELIVPEKVVERIAPSYFTYPKSLFIQRILEHNEVATNDQRHLRSLPQVRTTEELRQSLWHNVVTQEHHNHTIRKASALDMPARALPVEPYVYGAWLGDGATRTGNICGEDQAVFDHVEELGYELSPKGYYCEPNKKNPNFRVATYHRLAAELRAAKLSSPAGHMVSFHGEWKHIPDSYLTSSEEQRRELLRGLLDTDGTVGAGGQVQFAASNERLMLDVKRLIASLGYIPYVNSKIPTYEYQGERKKGKRAYTVSFQAPPEDRLFHLTRKNEVHAARFRGENLENTYNQAHMIVDIREVEPVPMRCISVDAPDRLFLISDSLIPTHNSVLQRSIVFHCIQHNDMWQFLGVDLKRVELPVYRKYSKTVKAIAVELEAAVELIREVERNMMERFTLMEERGVQHFTMLQDENGKHPKAIMLMIDEAYVLLSMEGAKTDEGKARDQLHGEAVTLLGSIARLGRAAGVHMLVATQRPDAAVIPGELRNNLETRIAAGRLNSTASSMILDSGAGTRLPKIKGRGMLFYNGEYTQFQGFFAQPQWIDGWLENHKEREPSIFGLPDDEDDIFGNEDDGIDFVADDQLEFELDAAARSRLETFPEPEAITENELPEVMAQYEAEEEEEEAHRAEIDPFAEARELRAARAREEELNLAAEPKLHPTPAPEPQATPKVSVVPKRPVPARERAVDPVTGLPAKPRRVSLPAITPEPSPSKPAAALSPEVPPSATLPSRPARPIFPGRG